MIRLNDDFALMIEQKAEEQWLLEFDMIDPETVDIRMLEQNLDVLIETMGMFASYYKRTYQPYKRYVYITKDSLQWEQIDSFVINLIHIINTRRLIRELNGEQEIQSQLPSLWEGT